jgi:transposase
MEACSTSHHWARRFQASGHDVRLIHPNFVRPYVKGNKNDELDAEAICEAASRPNIALRAGEDGRATGRPGAASGAERLVRWRTALINQIRGIMGERGIVFAQGARRVGPGLQDAIADHTNELTGLSRGLLATLADELAGLEARLHELDHQLVALCRQSELCRRVSSVPGIGPVIATALWRASAMADNSKTAANSPLGSGSYRDSAPAAAKSGWSVLASAPTAIFAIS